MFKKILIGLSVFVVTVVIAGYAILSSLGLWGPVVTPVTISWQDKDLRRSFNNQAFELPLTFTNSSTGSVINLNTNQFQVTFSKDGEPLSAPPVDVGEYTFFVNITDGGFSGSASG